MEKNPENGEPAGVRCVPSGVIFIEDKDCSPTGPMFGVNSLVFGLARLEADAALSPGTMSGIVPPEDWSNHV